MDERKWIERILAGDMQSFSCLVAKYEKMAYTIALRILENREEAEEAVQDAFVKMYRALSDFHFDSKFSTWFYRIVYRTALTALRQQRMFVSYEEAGPVDLSNGEVESATALLESFEGETFPPILWDMKQGLWERNTTTKHHGKTSIVNTESTVDTIITPLLHLSAGDSIAFSVRATSSSGYNRR